jgi:hypothetical protein
MFGIVRKATAVLLMASTVFMFTGCSPVTVTITITVQASTGPSTPIHHKLLMDPAGSDVANFDTTQGLLTMALSNATISSTSGTFILSIIDHASQVTLGKQTFNYVVNGTSLFAQDPTTVHNWLQQFASDTDVDVQVDVTPTVTAISTGSVSSTGKAVYQGTTYATATANWTYSGSTGSGCGTHVCPN